MAMNEKIETEKIEYDSKRSTLVDWLANILKTHHPPAVLMFAVDEEGKFRLLGAASNSENLSIVLEEKQRRNPISF